MLFRFLQEIIDEKLRANLDSEIQDFYFSPIWECKGKL
jgi:hypothetical protein